MSLNTAEPNANSTGTRRHGLFYKPGQILGVTSGVVTCVLWTLSMWDPTSALAFSTVSIVFVFVMILFGVIAIIASIKGHGTALLVLFVVSFLPIDMYVLTVQHWLNWVGLANIGYLVAGLLIKRATVRVTTPVSDREPRP